MAEKISLSRQWLAVGDPGVMVAAGTLAIGSVTSAIIISLPYLCQNADNIVGNIFTLVTPS